MLPFSFSIFFSFFFFFFFKFKFQTQEIVLLSFRVRILECIAQENKHLDIIFKLNDDDKKTKWQILFFLLEN